MSRVVLRSMVLLVVASSLAAEGLAGAGGGAIVEATSDAEDVEGKLDLARLRYDKSGPNAPMQVKIRTHEAWHPSVLEGNENKLKVMIDPDEDGSATYRARIKRVGNRLMVFIDVVGEGPDIAFEPLPAHKPKPDSVVFTIPGNSPPNPGGTVNMKAISRFIETQACDPGSGNPACVDRVPNAGWL